MASFSAGTTFTDGVANDVTAAKLAALVNAATPTSGFIQDRTSESAIAADDTLLFGDFSDSNNLKRMTVANFNNVVTTGTGTAASPAIVPTGDSNTGVFFPAADTIAFSEGGAEAMRIDSSGNVGIGTTSPATKLSVVASANSGINVTNGTMTGIFFNSSDTSIAIGSTSNHPVTLFSNNAERLRIDSSGNVLIGTTSADFAAGVGVKFAASATTPVVSTVLDTSPLSNTYILYNTNATNNGYRFYVASNGGVANFSANNANLSDERLKTNINLSGNYLDKICSIPVRTFNYKDQGEDTEKTIGVIAQEVEAHIPELVNNDGFGETPADGIPLKTIYQTDLQYVLMRCIQELKSENDSLKSRIEALEAA